MGRKYNDLSLFPIDEFFLMNSLGTPQFNPSAPFPLSPFAFRPFPFPFPLLMLIQRQPHPKTTANAHLAADADFSFVLLGDRLSNGQP